MSNKSIHTQQLFKLLPLVSLIVLTIFFSIRIDNFFSVDNAMLIVTQASVIAIMAIGVTFVIITAGIDLSIGSLLAISGTLFAIFFVKAGIPLPLALLLGAIVGGICGFINGILVARYLIPPFVVTLGMMMLARGFSLTITDGRAVYFPYDAGIYKIFEGKIFNVIPLPLIYLVIIALITIFILRKTVLGKHIYAVGSNEEAAHLSGINVNGIKIFVYSFCGFLTGIAGVILASRLNSGQPTIGVSYELDAIAAAVIGGTSLSGGVGTVGGTIIGVLLMNVLKTGLEQMGVNQFMQMMITGLVLIIAVYVDVIRKKKHS
ncbi:MAG: ABC transporter permease [Alphaproteobacteria bacterium]